MDPSDTLPTISEIALGLAGFSGVLVVLGRRPGRFSPAEAARVGALLAASLSALFLSIIPLVLHDFGLSGPALWRACSSIMVVALFVSLALLFRPIRSFRSSGSQAYSAYVFWAVSLGAAVNLLLQVANVAGFMGGPSPGPYSLGLIIFLAVGAVQFVRILFVRAD